MAEVGSLEEVIARMQALQAGLAPDDGVRHFNGLYLAVTQEVQRRPPGIVFERPDVVLDLAIRFSRAWFRAVDDLDAGPDPGRSRAWAPLFAARRDMRVAPVQFALAGMNAHINFDLPFAVLDTCRALGLEPEDGSPLHRDYLRINELLEGTYERAKAPLTPGLLGVVDRALGRLDDVVASFSVARARDAAWAHARTLWSLRDDPSLSASYAGALEGVVGLAGRGLLRPSVLGLARWASGRTWLPWPLRRLLGAPPKPM